MERKTLEGLGLDKETVDKVMAEHGKSVEKQKTQIAALTSERDGLKAQTADVSKKLAAFDGVDAQALGEQIKALQGEIAQKESDFKTQLADRDFEATLTAEIAAAKGRNPKAVKALLDIDALKASKNQKEDIAAALKTLRESDEAYQFEEAQKTKTTPAKVSTGGEHNEDGGAALAVNDQMNAIIRGKAKGETE
jgi:predicted  nucleic acid-binding Zn-ribbon protein